MARKSRGRDQRFLHPVNQEWPDRKNQVHASERECTLEKRDEGQAFTDWVNG